MCLFGKFAIFFFLYIRLDKHLLCIFLSIKKSVIYSTDEPEYSINNYFLQFYLYLQFIFNGDKHGKHVNKQNVVLCHESMAC